VCILLPHTIKPMEPVLTQEPPERSSFLHSVKWDGVRQLLYLESRNMWIHNRKLRDRTGIYPELEAIRDMAKSTGLVFDGEVVALNKKGRPEFQRVMVRDSCKASRVARDLVEAVPIYYCIFDLLFYKGESIMGLPLTKRLELLREVLPNPRPPIQLVEHLREGGALFQRTKELGLEGVVSKEASGRYLPGTKSRLWLKSKHYRDMIVCVGGFTVKNDFLNALSVGAFGEDGNLYYLGNVATGLTQADLTVLDKELRGFVSPTSPFVNFNEKAPTQFWTLPVMRLRVKYLELTSQGRLRHPVVLDFVSADSPTDPPVLSPKDLQDDT
jgi:bifunctional non-homologous end joining protein LigD